MRILHVVHQFYPHHRHGVEQSTLELATAQQAAGDQVHILTGSRQVTRKEVVLQPDAYAGLALTRMHFTPRDPWAVLESEAVYRETSRLLQRLRPDVVHVQHLLNLSLSVIHAVKDAGVPLVMTLRDFTAVCERINLVKGDGTVCRESDLAGDCARCMTMRTSLAPAELFAGGVELLRRNVMNARSWRLLAELALRTMQHGRPVARDTSPRAFSKRREAWLAALKRVDRLVAISGDTAGRVERFLEGQVHVQPLHQAPRVNDRIRYRWRKPEGKIVFGYLGKITPVKGLHLLLKAFQTLPKDSAELHIYGAPTQTNLAELAYWKRMQGIASRLQDVRFCGTVPREEVGSAYDRFDVVVVPSVWFEAFGRVVVEALAAGLPVICPDEGGPAELVRDGVNGRHFTFGDVDGLADVMRELLSESARIKSMSEGAGVPKSFDEYARQVRELYVVESVEKGVSQGRNVS